MTVERLAGFDAVTQDVVAREQKPLHFDQNFNMPELLDIGPEE